MVQYIDKKKAVEAIKNHKGFFQDNEATENMMLKFEAEDVIEDLEPERPFSILMVFLVGFISLLFFACVFSLISQVWELAENALYGYSQHSFVDAVVGGIIAGKITEKFMKDF